MKESRCTCCHAPLSQSKTVDEISGALCFACAWERYGEHARLWAAWQNIIRVARSS